MNCKKEEEQQKYKEEKIMTQIKNTGWMAIFKFALKIA